MVRRVYWNGGWRVKEKEGWMLIKKEEGWAERARVRDKHWISTGEIQYLISNNSYEQNTRHTVAALPR
jgi:hypothetical protein